MRRLAEFVATTAGDLSRLAGRGGGTSLPGVVLLKMRPDAAHELAAGLASGSIAISATNGKTTTARMIVSAAKAANHEVVANTAGANLLRGIVSCLLAAKRARPQPDLGVFEVDEAALPATVEQVAPRVIVLMNLFRDQLDRYGELEGLIDKWAEMIAGLDPDVTLVLNADDPGVASLGHEHPNTIYFGVTDAAMHRSELSHAADSTTCRRCQAPLIYNSYTIGHFGDWRCPNDDSRRPQPTVFASSVDLDGLKGQTVTIETPDASIATTLQLPGLHNAYNAAAAVAAAHALGLDHSTVGTSLAATAPAFGRAERLQVQGRDLLVLLAKNPTGVNENIRTIRLDEKPLHLLAMLNDRTADGRDVSWIWDVDYESLLPRIARLTIAGDRAGDLALRFRYAGLDPELMRVVPTPSDALDAAIDDAPPGGTVYALPTYTAMLDLRSVLTERGITSEFWKDEA